MVAAGKKTIPANQRPSAFIAAPLTSADDHCWAHLAYAFCHVTSEGSQDNTFFLELDIVFRTFSDHSRFFWTHFGLFPVSQKPSNSLEFLETFTDL